MSRSNDAPRVGTSRNEQRRRGLMAISLSSYMDVNSSRFRLRLVHTLLCGHRFTLTCRRPHSTYRVPSSTLRTRWLDRLTRPYWRAVSTYDARNPLLRPSASAMTTVSQECVADARFGDHAIDIGRCGMTHRTRSFRSPRDNCVRQVIPCMQRDAMTKLDALFDRGRKTARMRPRLRRCNLDATLTVQTAPSGLRRRACFGLRTRKPRVTPQGFEPWTHGLKVRCSTAELRGRLRV